MSHPDLTRTVAALAAYDELDREFMRAPTCECEAFVESLHTAQKAIGDAFSLDTADRNDPEVARSWAAFNVERTREFVLHLTSDAITEREAAR